MTAPDLSKWQQRFWKRVCRTNGCWPWTGAHHERGYGRMMPWAWGPGRPHDFSGDSEAMSPTIEIDVNDFFRLCALVGVTIPETPERLDDAIEPFRECVRAVEARLKETADDRHETC